MKLLYPNISALGTISYHSAEEEQSMATAILIGIIIIFVLFVIVTIAAGRKTNITIQNSPEQEEHKDVETEKEPIPKIQNENIEEIKKEIQKLQTEIKQMKNEFEKSIDLTETELEIIELLKNNPEKAELIIKLLK